MHLLHCTNRDSSPQDLYTMTLRIECSKMNRYWSLWVQFLILKEDSRAEEEDIILLSKGIRKFLHDFFSIYIQILQRRDYILIFKSLTDSYIPTYISQYVQKD